MPSKKKPAAAWKEYPEPDFPNEEARAAYRKARGIIKDAWQRMQAGAEITSLRSALAEEGLTALPPEIGQLTTLTELYLYNNQLTALPPEIGQLTALTLLFLNDNQLTALPPEFGQLSALTRLSLFNNQLTALPPEFGQLSALKELSVRDNSLTALPPEIGKLTALTDLWLYTNQLTALPPEIGQLSELTGLYLYHNQLTALPPELRKLTKLRGLYLHGNDALGLPPEVLGNTWEEAGGNHEGAAEPAGILDYYFSSLGSEGVALREVKLILVGRGEVGKSSMADVLRGKPFVSGRERTDGISILPWEVKLPDGAATVRVWDFGGQEIMHGTHQFFLTHRSLYIVMVDGRHDRAKQDAEYWLKLVRAFGGESPVLVVMNRQKAYPFDLDREYLAKKYGVPLENFFRTDCESPGTIEPVREAVQEAAAALLATEERFPRKCWDLKEHLGGMKEDYLSEEAYRKLCRKYKLTDREEQEKLRRRLSDLGTVVSFPDDLRLAELTVLNPAWATDGIYRVVTNEALREVKHGQLQPEALRALLPKKRWPQQRHVGYVLALMAKFELCFEMDADGTVLVPDLLEDKTPPLEDWDAAQCVVLRYDYPVLPHGVLPRFITRTSALSQGRERWRSGVVLGDDGAEALIKADYDANTVSIWVRGEHMRARRGLLAEVRGHFRELHSRIKDLNPEELVAVPGHPEVLVSYRDCLMDERDGKQTVRVTIKGGREDVKLSEILDGVQSAADRRRAENELDSRGRVVQINVEGDYIEGNKPMNIDDHSIHARDITNSQVGQTLTNCTNMIQQQADPARKEALEELIAEVKALISALPAEKEDKKEEVATNLELMVKSVEKATPNRAWWSVSSEGLMEAAAWVDGFAGKIGKAVKKLGAVAGLASV